MLGDNIRELRKQKGITMKELGEVFGLGESTIGMYETNRRVPDLDIILKLSYFFKVPVSRLLGSGIYSNKEQIMKHLDIILKIMEDDFSKDNEASKFFLEIHNLSPEMKFKAISEFLLEAYINEENKEIRLTYYI